MKTKPILLLATALAVASSALFCIAQSKALTNSIKHPGYSWCYRCERTWDVVRGHDTPYDDVIWQVTTPNDTNAIFSVEGAPNDGKTHSVTVTNGVSCFPLCEECWTGLKTPEARLPYYRKHIDAQVKIDASAEKKWARLKAAVLAGN